MRFVLLFCISYLSSGCAHNLKSMIRDARPEIKESYDEMENMTVVKLKPMTIYGAYAHRITIGTICMCEGNKYNKANTSCVLNFISYSANWKFLNKRDVIVLADGVRFKLGESKREGWTRNEINYISGAPIVAVTESLTVPISQDELIKISSAKKVKARVGVFDFKVPKQHKAGLRQIAVY